MREIHWRSALAGGTCFFFEADLSTAETYRLMSMDFWLLFLRWSLSLQYTTWRCVLEGLHVDRLTLHSSQNRPSICRDQPPADAAGPAKVLGQLTAVKCQLSGLGQAISSHWQFSGGSHDSAHVGSSLPEMLVEGALCLRPDAE